ncbi:ABC-2 family transporter protein [Paenibacillus sp. S150]|uniref:ABC transporter permease n=1 Tax=Paenibacillus sp. S150 TaxID=2749826 RepID=UPI001C5A4601|nr:ABC-2 family transporter protein [Paenibacillus sp. S150]MBW4082729.1 ABC-2 family transporter protein [Paenibacillus sp. S150]
MVTYVIISTTISLLIKNEVIKQMERKIRSGEIAMDLIKPMNFKLIFISDTVGNSIFRLSFQLIPLLAVGSIAFGFQMVQLKILPFFLLSLINAAIIYFLITFIIGLLAFWYMAVWHLQRFLSDLIGLLSGSIIPLWFFPDFLQQISVYLPFRLIYFVPLSIYLGKTEINDIVILMLQQWFWIIVLWIGERLVWSKAINKLVIQGG